MPQTEIPLLQLQPFLPLAREAIAATLFHRQQPAPNVGGDLPPMGVFVTLRERETDALRGCIGHLQPQCKSLALEVISCAVAAAFSDPRFAPLAAAELPAVALELSFLTPPEAIPDPSHLDPAVFGVIVQRGHRTGTLLPEIDGIDTVDQQIAIACQKAGFRWDPNSVTLKRYRTIKIAESLR